MSTFARMLDEYLGEFKQRYEGRYYGRFRGIVHDIADPQQLGRIKVRCPLLFGTTPSGWCWAAPAMGGSSSSSPHGMFALPELGDMVWIELEEGNTGRPPVWSHGGWSKEAVPDHGRALPDESDVSVKGIPGMAIPASSMNTSEYGKVRVWQMPSGARIEFDETSGDERVQLYSSSGAHIEMLSDGSINIGAAGDVRIQATSGMFKRYVAQAVEDVVDGMVKTIVGGSWDQTVDKTFALRTGGSFVFDFGGVITASQDATSGDVLLGFNATRKTAVQGNEYLTVANQMNMSSGTDMFLQASGRMSLVAQNNPTNGGIPTQLGLEAQALNSRGIFSSVDATGVALFAGLEVDGTLGSVSLSVDAAGVQLGGLHIDPTGIVSLESIAIIQLGGVTAVQPGVLGLQFQALMTALTAYLDTHTHIGNLGAPTTPPVVPSSATITPLVVPALSTSVFLV